MANILNYTHPSLRRFWLWSSGVWRGGAPSDSKFGWWQWHVLMLLFVSHLQVPSTYLHRLLVFSLPQPSCRARTKRLHTTQRGALIWAILGYRSMEIPSSWSSRNRRIKARHVWTPHSARPWRDWFAGSKWRSSLGAVLHHSLAWILHWVIWDKYGLWHPTRNALGFRADCNDYILITSYYIVITSRTCHFLAISTPLAPATWIFCQLRLWC